MFSALKLIEHSRKLRLSKSSSTIYSLDESYSIPINFKKLQRNIQLRTYAGDTEIVYEIFQHEAYKTNLQAVKYIVDLGANIGLSTLYFRAMYPEANIWAVEPDKDNTYLFEKNLAEDISSNKVILIPHAVGPTDETVFLQEATYKYNSYVSRDGNGTPITQVSMPTIISTYNIPHIDLLKIDIEGAEELLFQNNLQWLQSVKCIIMECHSDSIQHQCTKALEQNHFQVSTTQSGMLLAINHRPSLIN